MSEAAPVDYLEGDIFIPEPVDTSLHNTLRRAGVLSKKIAGIATRASLGLPIDDNRASSDYHPKRHAELQPDVSHVVQTEFGSEHKIDVYGEDYLGTDRSNRRPVVVIPELLAPSDKGFKSPIIDKLSRLCTSQERSLITVSSEGFLGSLSLKQLCQLEFTTMAHNVQDCLDQLETEEQVRIPDVTASGGSRGGTLSLLLAAEDVLSQRDSKGKPDRTVPSMVPIAPAGLLPMNAQRKGMSAKQFLLDEPMHVVRKASQMRPKELVEYGRSYLETAAAPASALPAVAKTGLMFLSQNPLEAIGTKLNPDTSISMLLFEHDYITAPDNWEAELAPLPNASVDRVSGCHLSIDSTRIVYRYTRDHLLDEYSSEANVLPLRPQSNHQTQPTQAHADTP